MSEKTKAFMNEALKTRFGVEVEMNHITREKAARVAAEYFGTGRYENTAYRNGSRTWSAFDTQGREWKFSYDCSIAGPESERCELITPILTYHPDMELLQGLIRSLRKAGGRSLPSDTCGVHCHIDGAGHTPQSLRNFANGMASHEKLLIAALNLDETRIARYCRTVDPYFLKELNKKKPKTFSELADIWYETQHASYDRNTHYNDSRYHCWNLHSFFTASNIEIRMFQFDEPHDGRKGSLHAGQLRAFVELCLAMNHMAKTVKTASPKPMQMNNPRFAMRTWLNRLGFIGAEYKTARTVFTDRLSGNSAWRFRA